MTAVAEATEKRYEDVQVSHSPERVYRHAFFYKGTNQRWRGVLTEEELSRYKKRVSEVLDPEAARWLERGRHESSLPR